MLENIIWCAHIFYARMRIKNVRTPKKILRGEAADTSGNR